MFDTFKIRCKRISITNQCIIHAAVLLKELNQNSRFKRIYNVKVKLMDNIIINALKFES